MPHNEVYELAKHRLDNAKTLLVSARVTINQLQTALTTVEEFLLIEN